jgi:hypothetical protein
VVVTTVSINTDVWIVGHEESILVGLILGAGWCGSVSLQCLRRGSSGRLICHGMQAWFGKVVGPPCPGKSKAPDSQGVRKLCGEKERGPAANLRSLHRPTIGSVLYGWSHLITSDRLNVTSSDLAHLLERVTAYLGIVRLQALQDTL